jgi:hypothetical protein
MELATEVEVNAAFAKAKKLRDAKANAQDDPSGGEWEPDLNDPEMLRKEILKGLRIL